MRRKRILTAALVIVLLLLVPVARSSGTEPVTESPPAAFDPRAAQAADRMRAAGIVDLPVRFTVRNSTAARRRAPPTAAPTRYAGTSRRHGRRSPADP